MGKSKFPGGTNPAGIAAYQKILDQKDVPPDGENLPTGLIKTGPGLKRPGTPSPGGLPGELPLKKGLVKTGRPLPPPQKPFEKRPIKETLPVEKRPVENRQVPETDEAGKESKYRRVAKFLILIGSEEASRILAQLERDQVEAISREIALIRGITPEESELILEEFRSLLSSPYGYTGVSHGGIEAARRILYAVYGPEKGEALLKKTVPEAVENLFDFLEDFSPDQLCLLFREESPAAAAMVLSRLSPALSAGTLARLPPERKLEIVRRIARLGVTETEVLERAAAALREKARHFGRSDRDAANPDGMNALTAILKHSDLSFGDRILEELEDKDPELGRNLKERLYTLEDLVYADDRPLQAKLRSLSDKDIALLLKGRSEAFSAKIFTNLSGSRGAQVREEAEIMGPVPKRDVDAVGQEFLAWFRQGREEGKILLLNSEDVIL